jgi:hypothetical protein
MKSHCYSSAYVVNINTNYFSIVDGNLKRENLRTDRFGWGILMLALASIVVLGFGPRRGP